MATHSSILAPEIPRAVEPHEQHFMGLQNLTRLSTLHACIQFLLLQKMLQPSKSVFSAYVYC